MRNDDGGFWRSVSEHGERDDEVPEVRCPPEAFVCGALTMRVVIGNDEVLKALL